MIKKNLNYSDDDLLQAAKKGDLNTLKRALKDGANMDSHGVLSETPLICAAKRGHLHIVEALLAVDANPNAKSRPAARSMTALMWAAENGFEEVVRLLIKSGADVSARNSEDKTAYHLAEMQNHRAIIEILGNSKT